MGTPPVVDANGDLVVLNGALRSGFRTISGETKSAAIPTPVPALLAAGRTGPALSLVPSGSVDWPALFGPVSKTVRAAEFWAKAVTASTVNASTGATDLGFVTLIADGAWHRYVLPFPTDVPVGSPVLMFVAAVGAGPNLPVILDSVTLVARPFETVSLVSNNGFQGLSVVTGTVSGLWSADPHFMSAVRTSDGGEGCVGCLHVPVPVSGSVAFSLSPGVYRIVVETGDVKSTVGVSATFTVNVATTTTTTTTTTTLPEFIVAGNDVWNGYGEVVVLDDAFRSGFRLATADAAATPVVARATLGRSNAAVIFDPSSGAVRGQLRSASTGVRFWAKVESGGAPSVYALVGGAARGTVALTADGGWHEYTLSFGATLSGLELMLLGTATGTAKFLLDDVSLILPPAPPVPTTAPAPTGYWSTVVSVDWRAGMRCLVFPDANGYVTSTSCDFVALAGSLPASVSGVFSAIVLANQAMLDAGAVADDVYNTYGTGTYTHSVSTQVWVPGPPPVTVPPVPQYPDWGVVLRQYGNAPGETYGFETRFGSPPFLGSGFTTAYGAQQAVLASGALGDNPPYGNTYTHYSTTPPTTTTPVQTTTTTTVPPIVTTPTRPPAFSSYPNYLRSQKLKNDGAVAQCLTPGGSPIESFAANCDAANALLSFTWDALAQGYLVKQGSTCLQVDYNAPDPQVLLPSGAPAAKVGWVTCGSTGPGAVWVPTFVETDASNAGWYQLVPNARPGVPTPCLNLNLGASQSTQMLVEYNCQGGTHTEERWAPNESFWTAPGGTGGGVSTTTTPTTATTIPIGTDFFDAVETSIKSFNGGCVDHGDDGDGAITALGCPIWTPEGGYSQMLFHPNVDLSRCLQTDGAVLTIGDCAPFAYNQQVRLTPVGNQWHLLAFNSNVFSMLG